MADESPPDRDERASAAGDEPAGGVFGNLPRSRPGTRSPRRRRAEPAAPDAAEPAATQARDTAPPRAPRRAEPGDEPDELADDEQPGGIEDLAWAGVAAAAEAATLGVRLANRALGAVRDTIDRR